MISVVKEHKCFGGVVQFCEHDSDTTRTTMKFSLFKPAGQINGCLIWLSGLTCTEENFITKAGAQRYLAEHGLMVVCPDTSPRGLQLPGEHDRFDFGSGASFYVDATRDHYRDHYKMYSYVADEFYALIRDSYGLGKQISISGHSMGGHGALIIGLREPEKFRSISAFAPLSNPSQCAWGKNALRGYLGDDENSWRHYDACELIKGGRSHPEVILIDQGSADPFLSEQLLTPNLIAAIRGSSQRLDYRFREGFDHSYFYVSSFIEDHVLFHAEILKNS